MINNRQGAEMKIKYDICREWKENNKPRFSFEGHIELTEEEINDLVIKQWLEDHDVENKEEFSARQDQIII